MTTVKELRDYLGQLPDELMVFAQWEGVNAPIDLKKVELKTVTKRRFVVLDYISVVFDVNEY